MTDFIGIYDEVLRAEDCKRLIKKFERSRQKSPGVTGHGVNPAAKDSSDINISLDPEWADETQFITELTERWLVRYLRSHVHLLTGAVVVYIPHPETGQPMAIDPSVIAILDDDTVLQLARKLYRLGTINLQRYTRLQGGYHHFHSEIYPQIHDADCTSLHRVLLFMYYLNDVREGGETEFYYQARKLKPVRGQLVFAPAGFTHTHKGHVPVSNDKYILTSWVLFKPAKLIYANQLQS
ncbi:MAG: proline hydroxylase [Candidatus Melainabacteria bacterium HGW-Melainabacteria-1]|nr:MAG: proline hydroxylase [Candidatus Melainabacteria bacterium HGW-Melainabacteria-1]